MYRFSTLVDALSSGHENFAHKVALRDRVGKEMKEVTFGEARDITHAVATYLIHEKIAFQGKVGLIADVSHYWSLANASIQFAGAIDVPRGTDSTDEELAYILEHSGAEFVFVHTPDIMDRIENNLKKKKSKHKIKRYFLLSGKAASKYSSRSVTLADIIKKGSEIVKKEGKEYKEMFKRIEKLKPEHLSTIIYTSGTTGQPKGVMLTHQNLASQCSLLPPLLAINENDSGMTLLPPWHIFGRTLEHLMFTMGITLTYSDVKNFSDDMKTFKPTLIPAVPRIWESVYNKIMTNIRKGGKEKIFQFFYTFALHYNRMSSALNGTERWYQKPSFLYSLVRKLSAGVGVVLLYPFVLLGRVLVFKKITQATGGQLRFSVSGGGALPPHVDEFFSAIGITILEGYGLTETSPVLSVRRPDNAILGTVGPAVAETEFKVIDMEDNDITGQLDKKGTLHVRGPQVMKGYYKDAKRTAEVLSSDGWLNTGDLVRTTINGHISIVGRSKDTIVLLGGENVEPEPIEEQIKTSEYIADCMLVGQDQKFLGALLIPAQENMLEYAQKNNIAGTTLKDWSQNPQIVEFLKNEIKNLVNTSTGFKNFERVVAIRLLEKEFEKGIELSNKLSVKRHVVTDMYEDLIAEMFK